MPAPPLSRPTAAGADPVSPNEISERFEGDYRPSPNAPEITNAAVRLEPLQIDFLLRLADALNTTLDLNTLMHRVADLVRAVIRLPVSLPSFC